MLNRLLTRLILPFVKNHTTKNLIVRRGGIVPYYQLRHRFKQIGRDPWVQKSRSRDTNG